MENAYRNVLVNLWKDDSGQDLVEYALIAALIALAAVAGMRTLASNLGNVFTSISTALTSA
jgi:pilus assembly protein Flp/PilA